MSIIRKIKKTIAKCFGGKRLISFLKRDGVTVGSNCRIFSDITTTESYLIEIGDNVTISGNVTFITHDASIQKVLPDVTDLFGKIRVGNNCFIGSGAIIMYGVSLADNTIVAAGSVVTKSVSEPGKIVGGNPARVLGDVSEFGRKMKEKAININGLSAEQKKALLDNENALVTR